ncbi:MAG: thiazole biosynthesis adenylyltransferase ThiF [Acidimicrobiia bacterium]|nr:thiazole biosynthesis adenylyltransferase ThiF [Acidimicrobiia bacterium]
MSEPVPERYSRQVRFAGLGEEGQGRLKKARAAIVGCGALGSFQAASLARAGVGFLRIIDRDYVELNNLQRQWLFEESDAEQGLPKAAAAAQRLALINSSIEVEPVVADLTASNIGDCLGEVELVLDGTDNFETRYLINEFCVRENLPWIYGAAVESYGLVMPVLDQERSCLACLYPDPPSGAQPTCETAGVLNTVTSTVAALQCSMAMQVLSGNGHLVPRLITRVDVWSGRIRQSAQPEPREDCSVCRENSFPYLEGVRRTPISLCGRNAVQIHLRTSPLDLGQLEARLAPLGRVRSNEFALRFFLEPYEMTIFPDGRAIIQGTTDTGLARSLYARYVGG